MTAELLKAISELKSKPIDQVSDNSLYLLTEMISDELAVRDLVFNAEMEEIINE